jgi:hypothetical protein
MEQQVHFTKAAILIALGGGPFAEIVCKNETEQGGKLVIASAQGGGYLLVECMGEERYALFKGLFAKMCRYLQPPIYVCPSSNQYV